MKLELIEILAKKLDTHSDVIKLMSKKGVGVPTYTCLEAIEAAYNIGREEDRWVSLETALPDVQVPVLVFFPEYGKPNIIPCWRADWANGDVWFNTAWKTFKLHEATHWQPLPTAPLPPKTL